MNDTVVSSPQGPVFEPTTTAPWLLLIHRIPPEPAYLRVKTQRRLQKLGARALKNSVYVLPNSDESMEDFQWLAQDIRDGGGDAMICESTFVSGISNGEINRMFDATPRHTGSYTGLTWVTRTGVKVDRIGSAWLIRRFIDAKAPFKFVDGRKPYYGRVGEMRFDLYDDTDFGHEGDQCTFEAMAHVFGQSDKALQAMGEIVHDIDLKDDKFRRPEAAGIASLIAGIVDAHTDDMARIEQGYAVFENLYNGLRTVA